MTAFKKGDQVMVVGLLGESAAYNKKVATIIGDRKLRQLGPHTLDSYTVQFHDGVKGFVAASKVMRPVLCTDDDEWADSKVAALVKSLALKLPPGVNYDKGASA